MSLHAIPSWLVAVSVFVLPALEASALVGLIVPGETSMLLGGAYAATGRLSLALLIPLGAAGAVVGDSIGYWLGARHGERIAHGRLGRLVGEEGWRRAHTQLRKRGFVAVLFGRFPPVLRTLVPLLAGMAHVPYRTFVVANVSGGVVWATTSVLLGYAAGQAWRRVAQLHGLIGVIVLGVLLCALVALWVRRVLRARDHHHDARTS
jgi:membrane protein DedA with SNARE-associated domain